MWLLIKWLRPETIPSPKRKKIPLRTRLQLSLYRGCLNTLRKWYQKYAFSDIIVISGRPQIRVYHEYRDIDFESELKRLHLPIRDDMIERQGTSSSQSEKSSRRTYYNCFHLIDHFVLDISGEKVAIDHGDGRAIVSTVRGVLKESDVASLVPKFSFAGVIKEDKMTNSGRRINATNDSPSINAVPPLQRTPPSQKSGGIFGDDPLLGRDAQPHKVTDAPIKEPEPIIKNVAGLEIDESF